MLKTQAKWAQLPSERAELEGNFWLFVYDTELFYD